MQIEEKTIQTFKQYYLRDFGEFLSDEEAKEKFAQVVELVKIISQPINKGENANEK